MDGYSISFGSTCIFYRNLLCVRHDAIQRTMRYRHRLPRIHFEHYIVIQDIHGQGIQLRVNELKKFCYAKIINCCLYHNPYIQIDKVVMDTLIDGKIPRIYVSRNKEYTMKNNRSLL